MPFPGLKKGGAFSGVFFYWPFWTGLVALLFLLAHFTTKVEVGDEGVTTLGAWRILSGQVPYGDFLEIITPLSLYVLALAYQVLGVSVLTGRFVALAYGVLLLLGTHLLTRRFVQDPLWQAVPLAILAPFGVGIWPLPSHHWLADICLLFSILCLDAGLERRRWGWTFAGGILCGCGVLSLQDQGGYAVLAVSLVWLLFRRHFPRGWALAWLSGLLLPPLALYLFALRSVPPSAIFYDLFLFPLTRYYGFSGNVVGFFGGLKDVVAGAAGPAWSIAPVYQTLVLATHFLLFLLPPFSLVGLVFITLRKRFSPARTLLLWSFTAAFLGAVLHRWSLMNIAWGAPLLAIAFASGLEHPPGAPRVWVKDLSRGLAILFLVSMTGFGLARLLLMTPSNLHPVRTPRGTLATLNPVQARSLQDFVDAIVQSVPKDASAFVHGYVPFVNFLTDHPNPTPFNIFATPVYNTPEQAKAWSDGLETGGVGWGFGNAVALDPADPTDRYLQSHFEVAWRNADYVLWKRRETKD